MEDMSGDRTTNTLQDCSYVSTRIRELSPQFLSRLHAVVALQINSLPVETLRYRNIRAQPWQSYSTTDKMSSKIGHRKTCQKLDGYRPSQGTGLLVVALVVARAVNDQVYPICRKIITA